MRPRARRETEIQREILRVLNAVPGVVAWRTNSGMAMLPGRAGRPQPVRFGFPGLSDIIGWRERVEQSGCVAIFVAIEIKRPGQDATPQQRAFLDLVRHSGGIAFVAHSVEEVATAMGVKP